MGRPQAPCQDCLDLHENCHSECEKYQAFKLKCFNYNLKLGESKGYLTYLGEQKAESFFHKVRKKQKGVKK